MASGGLYSLIYILVKSQKRGLYGMENSIPIFISSPTNQMSHQETMPTKPFHYVTIYMCNNPNIRIILFSCNLHLNKEPY